MPNYLIQKDAQTLIPFSGTSGQADVYARNFTVYTLNADNSRTLYGGPTIPDKSKVRPSAAVLSGPTDDTPEVWQVPLLRTDPVTGLVSLVSGDGKVLSEKRVSRTGMALVSFPSALTDYTFAGGPTAEMTVRDGRRCMRLVSSGATAFDVQIGNATTSALGLKSPRKFTGRGSVSVEFPTPSQWAGGSLSLQLATDGTFANRCAASINAFGTNNLFFGVNNYAGVRQGTIPANNRFLEWTGFGTVPNDATMFDQTYTHARVRFTPAAGSSGSEAFLYGAWIDDFDESPSLIITTDDCHGSIYLHALDILERYGLRCSLGYIHDSVMAGGSSMTLAQCQETFARGHEFETHGCKTGATSLRSYAKNVALIRDDMSYNRAGLYAGGLNRVVGGLNTADGYVYPQGFFRDGTDYNDTTIIDSLKALGFHSARIATFQGGRPEPASWKDSRYFIPILGHNYNYSGNEANNLTDLIDRMVKTAEDGLSMPTMWHIILPTGTPTLSEQAARSNFERACEAAAAVIAAGKAVNRTQTEHVARCNAAFGTA